MGSRNNEKFSSDISNNISTNSSIASDTTSITSEGGHQVDKDLMLLDKVKLFSRILDNFSYTVKEQKNIIRLAEKLRQKLGITISNPDISVEYDEVDEIEKPLDNISTMEHVKLLVAELPLIVSNPATVVGAEKKIKNNKKSIVGFLRAITQTLNAPDVGELEKLGDLPVDILIQEALAATEESEKQRLSNKEFNMFREFVGEEQFNKLLKRYGISPYDEKNEYQVNFCLEHVKMMMIGIVANMRPEFIEKIKKVYTEKALEKLTGDYHLNADELADRSNKLSDKQKKQKKLIKEVRQTLDRKALLYGEREASGWYQRLLLRVGHSIHHAVFKLFFRMIFGKEKANELFSSSYNDNFKNDLKRATAFSAASNCNQTQYQGRDLPEGVKKKDLQTYASGEYLAHRIAYQDLQEDSLVPVVSKKSGNALLYQVHRLVNEKGFECFLLAPYFKEGRKGNIPNFKVLFRGTHDLASSIMDTEEGGAGNETFKKMEKSLLEKVNTKVKEYCQKKQYEQYNLTVAGHSLGGALSQNFSALMLREKLRNIYNNPGDEQRLIKDLNSNLSTHLSDENEIETIIKNTVEQWKDDLDNLPQVENMPKLRGVQLFTANSAGISKQVDQLAMGAASVIRHNQGSLLSSVQSIKAKKPFLTQHYQKTAGDIVQQTGQRYLLQNAPKKWSANHCITIVKNRYSEGYEGTKLHLKALLQTLLKTAGQGVQALTTMISALSQGIIPAYLVSDKKKLAADVAHTGYNFDSRDLPREMRILSNATPEEQAEYAKHVHSQHAFVKWLVNQPGYQKIKSWFSKQLRKKGFLLNEESGEITQLPKPPITPSKNSRKTNSKSDTKNPTKRKQKPSAKK